MSPITDKAKIKYMLREIEIEREMRALRENAKKKTRLERDYRLAELEREYQEILRIQDLVAKP